MSDLVYLHAESLNMRWGFGDGDTLSETYLDHDFEDVQKETLCILVRTHLLPKIEALLGRPVRYEQYHNCHNPITVVYSDKFNLWPQAARDVEVVVGWPEVEHAFLAAKAGEWRL